jgi:hypothetical protein
MLTDIDQRLSAYRAGREDAKLLLRAYLHLATNNKAEQARRPAMHRRKRSCGSDSVACRRFAARLLSMVATCRQQGRHLLDLLVAAGEATLRGSPPPSPLAAWQGA